MTTPRRIPPAHDAHCHVLRCHCRWTSLGCLDSNSSTILLLNRPQYLDGTIIKVSHHAFYESFKLGPCRLVNGMTWAGEWSAYIDGQCLAKLSALPSSVGGQGRDSDWACMGRGGHDVLPS